MNNLVSIFTELKLKRKVRPWLADKFDGVRVFTSGLDSGSLGAGVLIIMNFSLAKHVCKVSEVPGWLLSIKLLFKNKLSVSILGLYAGASLVVWFSQAGEINSLIAKAINESFFVILGGDFNKDGSHKCASFKKCFDLGLINSLGRELFCETIDYMFVSSNLVDAVVNCSVNSVGDYFDTNKVVEPPVTEFIFKLSPIIRTAGLISGIANSLQTVYVSVELDGLLDKYDIKDASVIKWSEFRDATAANAVMFLDEFVAAKWFSDLDVMWDIVCKVMVLLAGRTFKKIWFKGFNCVFNKVFSQFHKLKLLVSKLVKASWLVSGGNFASLLDTWNRLDSVGASPVKSLFLFGTGFDAIYSGLAKVKKFYCSSKLLESKHAEESHIRQAIERRMESFEVDKGHTIRSVLEHPFRKVVLNHLVDGGELVLEPELIKSKVDVIMESWTRKCVVASDISGDWARQFRPLDHVFNSVFSNVMHSISFDKMFGIISNLPNGKAAGLSGITNELWKHCDKLVLDMLLVFLNFCLDYRISLAYSTFDVLHGDNFSVLKGTSTQLSIFAIGSVIKDVLEKNRELVMMNFDLTDGYHVHDGLDQREIFSPLLWHIFYDLLLGEVKRQESICGYRLISHFIFKTDQVESQAGLMSFLAANVFVDDTIWVSSSQAATQHILNVASDFFHLNNISINNDKTVTIPINCWVTVLYLTISGLPISIAKRGEPHCYLEIFLFSEGFLKPSLVKAHLDVWFFINHILRKVISNKQFAYLVSSVFFLIISYKTQFSFIFFNVCNKWDALICKNLKFKSGLSLDFPNDALYHFSLYNLKTFEQIQAESKSASVIAFANSVSVLGYLFSHRSHNLQVFSWRLHYPLLFPVHVRVSPLNNFLAGMVRIFSGCDLSLSGSLAGAFRLWGSTPMSLVLGEAIFFKCVSSLRHYGIAFIEQLCDQNGVVFNWKTFKHWKRLNFHGLVSSWFDLSVRFFGSVAFPSGCFSHEGGCGSSDIHQSLDFGVICNNLLNVGAACFSVYTDRSLSNLSTVDMLAGTAVFFEDIDSGLGVGVSGLVSSTLAELQTIALALECVPSFRLIDLFSDSQAAIDAYKLESLLVGPDFRNCCWIEHCYIANVIHRKNLDVNWIKIKSYSGVSDNEHANALAKDAAFSAWNLLYLISERFLKAGVDMVSGNSRHFVHNIFSVVCLFCDEVEVSDHVFSCSSNADICASLLDTYATAWEVHSGLFCSFLCVLQLLSTCISDVTVSTALCKGFVFSNWYHKSVSVYKDPKVAVVNVVNFVHEFCLAFHDNIWLVRAKHQAIMEKNKLISHDGSISVAVSGFSMWLSAGVIRLLGVADVLGISFGYYKCCLFYAGVGNMASVHISA
ncbi:hypothetical protein G9A89_022826 [Geosiphon pyriformis]|nr:hypothetical protein G9A89_022826 [Geosiphon pyriformis]